jgi:hypothetical protein
MEDLDSSSDSEERDVNIGKIDKRKVLKHDSNSSSGKSQNSPENQVNNLRLRLKNADSIEKKAMSMGLRTAKKKFS